MNTCSQMIGVKTEQIYLALITILLVGCVEKPTVQLVQFAVDESAGSVLCYKIETPAATYYLEKSGGGLSSIIDPDGTDWIGFNPESGTGAGGEYRGFPNAVYKQDGSFFHPRNKSTELSNLEIIQNTGSLVSIKATSGNGNWEAIWDFSPKLCTFTMTKMPADFSYWILYEGTPGGTYDDTDWYMTSSIQDKIPLTTNHERDIPDPEWIAFGDANQERVIVLLHHEDDNEIDRFYQMQKKMTVFGFGRNGMENLINKVPQSFSIGFVESTNHKKIDDFVHDKLSK